MSRERLIWDKDAGDFVSAGYFYAKQHATISPGRSDLPTPQIMRDISPYQSMRTGETIGGRKQHRDHLRAYNLVELGNEMPKNERVLPSSADIVSDIKRAIGE